MKTDKDFSPATPDETRDYAFDFVNDVADGETLASAIFTVEVAANETSAVADTDPVSRLIGSASIDSSEISGTAVVASQRLWHMVAGNRYRLICRTTTSRGQVLELYAYLWCREAD